MARIKPFTFGTAPNLLLNNKKISLKAKGLYTFMNSKPENWEFSYNGLQSQLLEQKSAIKTAIKELEKYGYLIRKKYKKENGQWGWEYQLTMVNYPSIENPSMEKPSMENIVDISKKELSKKDKVIKKENNSENKFSQDIATILELFSTINPSIQYGNKTQRKACEDMIKRFGSNAVINMVKQVISVQGEKYAPTATTPYVMYKKLGDFKIYFEKQRTTNGELLDLS